MVNMYADMEWHNDTLYMMQGPGRKMFVIDPATCTIVDSSDAMWGTGNWGQGIAWNNGYLWLTNSHGHIYRVDPYPPYNDTLWMSVEDTFWAYHPPSESLFSGPMTADAIVFALGYMWLLRNPSGSTTHILFQVDSTGQVIDSFALPVLGMGPEGLTFDGGCFWYTDHTNDMVYRVCLWGCDDSLIISGCLDSDEPDIIFPDSAICGDTLFVGEIDTTVISILDSFFVIGTECSVWAACTTETSFVGEFTDTNIIWTVPDLPCDSANLIVATYDSFGNRGWNESCPFIIVPCDAAIGSVACFSTISFSSCSTGYTMFHIEEANGLEIDTLRSYFTRIIFHPSGTADTAHFRPPTSEIFWSGSDDIYDVYFGENYADGDSVIIRLDSLFNVWGCKIIP